MRSLPSHERRQLDAAYRLLLCWATLVCFSATTIDNAPPAAASTPCRRNLASGLFLPCDVGLDIMNLTLSWGTMMMPMHLRSIDSSEVGHIFEM